MQAHLKKIVGRSFRKMMQYRLNLGVTVQAAALSGCGGSGSALNDANSKSFSQNYVPPTSNFDPVSLVDNYYEHLLEPYSEPYWVASLAMDRHDLHIGGLLDENERVIFFNFPTAQPAHVTSGIYGWEPASKEMEAATREILGFVETVLDVSFVEDAAAVGNNVISVARSDQSSSAGLSYFPNLYHEIGMDVFIATGYESPEFRTSTLTNYHYELLVHELGHALGLKHPFSADGANGEVLNAFEDKTANTAMSYNDNALTFDGTFRALDWMTLTKYYGVKASHNPGNDTYHFSSSGGTFIIDGAGLDTIEAADTSRDVTVDLRPGAHSYLGNKSSYITSANQLTISHGSDIENVETGSGDDTVIATALDNFIKTGAGNDTIFAGGGVDVIRSGTGSDRIDLSEATQALDTVVVDASLFDLGFDTIYGFAQGAAGDVLDLTGILEAGADLFPLVAAGAAPVANFSGGVLRLVGDDLAMSTDLVNAFGVGGALSPLSISDGAHSIIVSAASQDTGEDQSIFYAQGSSAGIQISQLALLQGNSLDIDQWHASNFGLIV